MSAMAGVRTFRADELGADEALLTMGRELEARGPDGCSIAVREPVAMLYRPFHTTPESRDEHQPHRSPAGALVTWDGRLDNPAELRRSLGLEGGGRRTDVELIAAAYDRWGRDFPRHLVGDFAVAVWDADRDRLLLARDPFGPRPLFYTVEPGKRGRLLWASHLTALIATGAAEAIPDEAWIAGYLVGVPPTGHTPYRSIHEVPAGCTVTFEDRRCHVERYWPPEDLEPQQLEDDQAYEERFRELLVEGVRCRLRAEGPVFAELSGGVDSSSVVCLAEELLRRGEATAEELEAVSFVFDEAPTSDEREFIRAVEARIGRRAHRLSERDHPLLVDLEAVGMEAPCALTAFRRRYQALRGRMQERGSRVILSGVGGDEVGWSEVVAPFGLADHLQLGRIKRWVRDLRRWQRALDVPLWQLVWRGTLCPLVPGRDMAVVTIGEAPAWLHPDFVRRSRLSEWPSRVTDGSHRRLPLPSHRLHSYVVQAMAVRQLRLVHHHEALLGREKRYPFLHRPLVEFCLTAPFDQLYRPGESRSLHRRALRGVLPSEIAERRDKQGPDEAIVRAVARQWSKLDALLGPEARIVRRGIAVPEHLRTALERCRFGVDGEAGWVLRALELELWLRRLEGAGAPRLLASA